MKNKQKERAAVLAQQFYKEAEDTQREILLPIPGIPTAPDFKFRCMLKRVEVLTLIENGQLPEHLSAQMMGVKAKTKEGQLAESAEKVKEMTLDDLYTINNFKRKVAVETCLAPALYFPVENGKEAIGDAQNPDAVNLSEIDFAEQLVAALYSYATNGSPGVLVELADGGTTTHAAVANFPESASGAQPVDASPDGTEPRLFNRSADGASG